MRITLSSLYMMLAKDGSLSKGEISLHLTPLFNSGCLFFVVVCFFIVEFPNECYINNELGSEISLKSVFILEMVLILILRPMILSLILFFS